MSHKWNKAVSLYVVIVIFAGCSPDLRTTAYQADELYQGYPCVPDCSAFKAGYDQAQQQKYSQLDQCGQHITPTTTGCKAYVTEYQLELKEAEHIRQQLSQP